MVAVDVERDIFDDACRAYSAHGPLPANMFDAETKFTYIPPTIILIIIF